MKRTPLKRKTPLSKGACQLKKSKLKQVSSKRRVEGKQYSELRKKFLFENPFCYGRGINPFCTVEATEVHHAAKRGRHYLNSSTFRAVCRACHTWAEQNRKQAEAIGLTLTVAQIESLP